MVGKYFDELEVGETFHHTIRRTITKTDNVLFTKMTHNPALLHLDEEYCRIETEFGKRVANSGFTLSVIVGTSVHETTLDTATANLGWEEDRFPRLLFHGNTIRVEPEIIDLRESEPRPKARVGTFQHRAYNQDDNLVVSCTRIGLQKKKPIDAAA